MIRTLTPVNFVFQFSKLMNLSQVHLPVPNSQFTEMSMSYPTFLASDPRARMLEVSARVDLSLASAPRVVSKHPVANQFCFCLSLINTVIVHAIPKLCNNTASKERADLNRTVVTVRL
jgi:hypothetical protein